MVHSRTLLWAEVTEILNTKLTVGYAGPDLNNPSDPNNDVLFEFAEFTVTNKEYWGNTTRVDFFSFPVVTRLVGQDVLEGKGNFNRGNSTELVIEAQLCAAFNRGVATDPANYQNPSAYYKNSTYNYYSAFMHKHSVNNFAYGFCYDDVNDQSTLLHYTNPTALILDLKW